MKQITIITGPTASGKTSYSLEYAKKFKKAIIINADASAVYRGFPILTAFEESIVPSFLFQIADITEDFSVAKWLNEVALLLFGEQFEGHHKIIVGGSMMYIFLLINGLVEVPAILPEFRSRALEEMNALGFEAFLEKVRGLDSETNQDKQRLLNNYSLILQTGKNFKEWQKMPKRKFLKEGEFELIKLMPEREVLYENCNNRFAEMLERGATEEVRRNMDIFGKEYDFRKILGANEIRDYILGLSSLEEASQKAMQRTRNLAKSQTTWLNNKL